jgi:hypothetical protein
VCHGPSAAYISQIVTGPGGTIKLEFRNLNSI